MAIGLTLRDNSFNSPLQLIAEHQQKLKWIVYTLLVLNFGYYIFDDWRAAQSVLLPDASFLDITSSYATSFDELAWFALLFLFEFETYWADDEVEYGLGYWVTAIECVAWLSIVLLITFVMMLQNAGIYESGWIRSANTMQYVAYASIIGCALTWSWYGYYVYTWDSLLWIGGFAAIDANLSDWRDELKDKQITATC